MKNMNIAKIKIILEMAIVKKKMSKLNMVILKCKLLEIERLLLTQ